ncbi:ankyrin repeat domain-containing protein [Glaciecola petra]|uniref:Ankyrin repeat domain-containing protein n=1 Tax=Glaciecola petra TaxID=3075602 RepID=A0ABU2ZUK9_9ALTE|nr:ankyrin repeat domain-containing protein [Aestuariibacter sp. P117]MDT0596090.1 ankyrin repeat domain-containing protein [Aestuariibacter sp. P117]
MVKKIMAIFLVISLIACTSESALNSVGSSLDEQEHQRLLLKTKRAILNLDRSLLESLVTQIDVNRLLPDKSSLLAWATETQDPILVNIILENGANVQNADGNRFSPLIQACRYGNTEIILALLTKGASPNISIDDGTNAFHLCAGSASTEVLEYMINVGADINAKNDKGQTALMWSANAGNVENLNYLVNIGADINEQSKQGYSVLFFAIKSQNLPVVKTAVALGANLFAKAKDGTTAMQLGVYTKNYAFLTWIAGELNSFMNEDEVKQVITAFDRNGQQLIHAAVQANQADLVKALLVLGADINQRSEPSKLKWRYEANFKTEDYVPPQLTAIEIAKQQKLEQMMAIMTN